MEECKKKCFIRPDGVWKKEELIGAKCRVVSMPASNFFQFQDADRVCTIGDIYFRVSLDGKTITTITLLEYPDIFFTWRDLEIVGLDTTNLERSEV